MHKKFDIQSPFTPSGDQPKAIKKLTDGIQNNLKKQTLLGVTGSGKTFSCAHVIQNTQKPALVISHNKTLAAQLADEFKEFFPNNAVEYFVSYYDYYQPEAYIPRTDTYIAKDASINDEIDRLRHSAMEAILTRQDVIVVASVSCIYGLGSPDNYLKFRLTLTKNQKTNRRDIIDRLTKLQYSRNDTDFKRGTFRLRGDIIDIHPASTDQVVRVELFGETVDRLMYLDSLTGEVLDTPQEINIFPATFFLTEDDKQKEAINAIRQELAERLQQLKKQGKIVEAQRLEQRTTYDLEMMEHIGYVSGIENYSRHLDKRSAGDPPDTLIDYFLYRYGRNGFLTFIDESHMSIPQISAMYAGDQARKQSLVEHGFRLPSAKDNRPLQFHEFENRIGQSVFISATPAKYEINTSEQIVEQIVRPTGLLDPEIEVRPTKHQIDDVINEVQIRTKKGHRTLITSLTKRMAEELSTYLIEMGIKSAYLHSDIDTLERLEILRDLRLGTYDVVIGINLLREGLDLPEVSLIAILDADKEGYLRSTTSLIQTIGRAARHKDGYVIMYGDRITGSMQEALNETKRRRAIQTAYNQKYDITPTSIIKNIRSTRLGGKGKEDIDEFEHFAPEKIDPADKAHIIKELSGKMDLAARNLDFERAAKLRDVIKKLRQKKK